jgi:hypothetical protein
MYVNIGKLKGLFAQNESFNIILLTDNHDRLITMIQAETRV